MKCRMTAAGTTLFKIVPQSYGSWQLLPSTNTAPQCFIFCNGHRYPLDSFRGVSGVWFYAAENLLGTSVQSLLWECEPWVSSSHRP